MLSEGFFRLFLSKVSFSSECPTRASSIRYVQRLGLFLTTWQSGSCVKIVKTDLVTYYGTLHFTCTEEYYTTGIWRASRLLFPLHSKCVVSVVLYCTVCTLTVLLCRYFTLECEKIIYIPIFWGKPESDVNFSFYFLCVTVMCVHACWIMREEMRWKSGREKKRKEEKWDFFAS